MRVCIALDLFQEQISALMDDLDFFIFYLNNFLIITTGSCTEHLAKGKKVIKWFQLDGIKHNIDKF